uniref:Uncharacterized protein n=1 Tax=Glossina morsitans morsitans TaxID=37546 RepID=A0A1B0GB91_GLOMM
MACLHYILLLHYCYIGTLIPAFVQLILERKTTLSLKKSRILKKQEISEPELKSKLLFPRGQSDDDKVCMGHLNNQIDLDDEEECNSERKGPSKKCKKSKKDSPCSQLCKLCDKEGHTLF